MIFGMRNEGEQNQKWLAHPCLLGGPQVGGVAPQPLRSKGFPTKGNKSRSGFLKPAISWTQKRAELLHNPYTLGDPQQRRTKSEVVALPLRSGGPTRGPKCYGTPMIFGMRNEGEQNQKWLPHPCLLRDPQVGRIATYFSGTHKWAELLRNPGILGDCIVQAD